MSDTQISVSRVIPAPPEPIFDVLTDPAMHPVIDGSGTVRGDLPRSRDRLRLGSRFGMRMKIFVPYLILNKVVEYEANRRIAWRHFVGHRWRYELEPVDGATRVTETFDWSTAVSKTYIELFRYPQRHEPAMERTLERLEQVATTGAPTS